VILLVEHDDHAVVCVQIDSCVSCHLSLLLSGSELWTRWVTMPLLYCPAEEPSR
jgi:hypothetical protein